MFFEVLGDLSGLKDIERFINTFLIICLVVIILIVLVIYIIEAITTNKSYVINNNKSNYLVWIPILHRYYLVEQATNKIVSIIYSVICILLIIIFIFISNTSLLNIVLLLSIMHFIYGFIDLIFYILLLDKIKIIK